MKILKVFVILFLCLAVRSAPEDIIALQDSVSYPDEISKLFGFHYFKFTPNSSQAISIEAAPRDESSMPVLYVSTSTPYPFSTNAEFSSIAFGYNLLTITKENVTAGKDIYITVECLSPHCIYNLEVATTTEHVLQANAIQNILFKNRSEVIVRFNIPKLDNVTHIVIYAQIVNAYAVNETIHMYVNKGDTVPTSSSHDLDARTSWLDSKAVIAYSHERSFCTGCTYTALIEAANGTGLRIQARTYFGVNNITLYSRLYDAVNSNSSVTYFLNLTAYDIRNSSVTISFETYEGYSQLYLNPDTLPRAVDQYKWNIRDPGLIRFVLTEKERNESKIINGIYITVLGISPTTYQLNTWMSGEFYSMINYGYEETGYAGYLETVRYYVWGNRGENFNVTLTGKALSGKATIYVKSCGKSFCWITDDDIAQNQNKKLQTSTVNSTFLIGLNTSVGMNQLHFYHNGTACGGGTLPISLFEVCVYAMAVVGLSKPDNHYTLIASQERTPMMLKEGQPLHASVAYTTYEYFSFTITNGEGIQEIRFIPTTISGKVVTYLSRSNIHPSSSSFDQVEYNSYSISYPASGTPVDFTGTYYLAVYGYTASTFTLTVVVERKPADNSTDNITTTPIQLRLGQSQKITLNKSAPSFFYFASNIPWWYQGTVDFTLVPIKGTFDFYMNSNGTYPKNGSALWVADGNQISIDTSDPGFNSRGQYQIGIYPDSQSPSAGCSFIMMVALSEESFYLYSNIAHHDYLNKETPLYFEVYYFEGDDDLIFTKHSGSDEFEIYLSVDPETPYPTEYNYNLSTATHHTSVLVANKTYLNSACGFEEGSGDGPCIIYGSARTNSTWWVWMSLLLSLKNQTNIITEGQELAYPILSNNPILFTYEPDSIANGVTIMAFSYHQKVALVANAVKSPINYEAIKFPTLSSYDFISKQKGIGYFDFSNTITLRKNNFTGCGPDDCGLAIAVYPQETQDNGTVSKINQAEGFIPEFSILVSSSLIPLTVGQSIEGLVWENEYVYYSLRVNQPVCHLYISLTPVSQGDPDIVVSYGADQRPTVEGENYDFSSLTDRSEQIEISNKDILPDRVSMEGVWVIGVFGYSDVMYKLSVFYEDSKILLLEQGVPFEFMLQTNNMVYFKFYHYYQQDIKIRLTREFGFGNVYVNKVLDWEELYDNLPNRTNHQWSTFTSNTRDQIEISTSDTNYCRHCYYLIQVQASDQNLKFVITVMLAGEPVILQSGKGLRDYVRPNESNYYSYTNVWGKQVDINLIVYSGEVALSYSKGQNSQGTSVMNLGKNFLNLQILPAEAYMVYIIKVGGISMANYTILVNSEDRVNWLVDGVLQYGYLNPNALDTYQFFCDQSYSTHKRLKIVVNIYNDEFNTRLPGFNSTGLPLVDVSYRDALTGPSGSKTIKPDLLRNDTTLNGLTSSVRITELIQYAVRNGTWTIQVKNDQNFLLNYSIVAKTKDIYVIPLNTAHLARLGVREFDIFEVYIYEKGTLAIEVLQCYGRVTFSATSSIEKLHDDDFDLVIHTPYDDLLYGELEVNAGILYIKVRAIEGLQDDNMDPTEEALFKIETRFFKTSDVKPYQLFFAGEDGRVSWSSRGDGVINLNWKHLGIDHQNSKSLFDQYNVVYKFKIVLAKDNIIADTVAKCDWVPQKFEGYFDQIPQFVNTSEIYLPVIKSEQDFNNFADGSHNISLTVNESGSYFVQIVAMAYGMKGESAVWQVPIVYKTTEVTTTFSIVQVPAFWAVLGGLTIIILGFFVYRYYRKYRVVKQRLNFELQEVRLGNNVIEAQSDFVPSESTKESGSISRGPSNNSQYQDFAEEEKTEL